MNEVFSQIIHSKKPVPDKTASLTMDVLFGTEFQKIGRKLKIWILSNISWNTTNWIISLIQIYKILVDLIMIGIINKDSLSSVLLHSNLKV